MKFHIFRNSKLNTSVTFFKTINKNINHNSAFHIFKLYKYKCQKMQTSNNNQKTIKIQHAQIQHFKCSFLFIYFVLQISFPPISCFSYNKTHTSKLWKLHLCSLKNTCFCSYNPPNSRSTAPAAAMLQGPYPERLTRNKCHRKEALYGVVPYKASSRRHGRRP